MRSMLAWFEGRWVGEVNGRFLEEIWTDEQGGQRHGMFRWHKEGKPWLYEWILMGEFDGRVQMRIKHFGADAIGWEEKDGWTEYHLVGEQDQRAEFHQKTGPAIIYQRTGDQMRIWFEANGAPPKIEDVLVLHLAN
jgi:hypothetical protein